MLFRLLAVSICTVVVLAGAALSWSTISSQEFLAKLCQLTKTSVIAVFLSLVLLCFGAVYLTRRNRYRHLMVESKQKDTKQLLVCIDNQNGNVEFYNPQNNSWHSSPVSLQLPYELTDYRLELFGKNMLYAFGGTVNDYFDFISFDCVWSLNLNDSSLIWKARAAMKHCISSSSIVIFNDIIYVLGGETNRDIFDKITNYYPISICKRYDSKLDKWFSVEPMNSARSGASAGVFDGCIYIAGGERKIDKCVCSAEKYDTQSDTWSMVAPMITARCDFTLIPFAGRLWAIGGKSFDRKPLRSCESYDPVTDTWREEAPLKEGQSNNTAVVFNGELYVIGGSKDYGKTKLTNKTSGC